MEDALYWLLLAPLHDFLEERYGSEVAFWTTLAVFLVALVGLVVAAYFVFR